MPQGERSPAEKTSFNHMLRNVNFLYLGCKVLILLDKRFIGRFWTQFEAYIAMRQASEQGLGVNLTLCHGSERQLCATTLIKCIQILEMTG